MVPTKLNNYAYQTVPQPGLNGRRGYQPRGKTLGGSSSINAMFYVRGNRWDYDHWASLGNPGWSYDDVLPLFKRAENNEQFKDDFHGQGGPLNVTYPRHESPLTKMFLEAAALHQIRLNPDYNGADQEGAFEYQVTQKGGERCSAATGLPHPEPITQKSQGFDPRRLGKGSAGKSSCMRRDLLPGRRAEASAGPTGSDPGGLARLVRRSYCSFPALALARN